MSFTVHDYTIPKGHPNRGGSKNTPKAVVIHYTGNYSATATDTANANYFKRAYKVIGGVEYESDGKTKFRYGSAHKIVDCDSLAICIPDDECCWGCGDRPNNYNNGYKGQTKIARDVFNYNQNYRSIQYELAINKDWDTVVSNSIIIVAHDMNLHNIPDTEIYRHYDVTGKQCPAPMIGGAKEAKWTEYKQRVIAMRKYLKENPSYYAQFIKGNAALITIMPNSSTPNSSPTNVAVPTYIYTVCNLAEKGFLNVRRDPSVTNDENIIGKLVNGRKVNYIHNVTKTFAKCCGYVNSTYLKNGVVNTPNDVLNVRLEASPNAALMFTLADKTKVEVMETMPNGWTKIRFFISSDYIKKG